MAQARAHQTVPRWQRLAGALMLIWGLRWLFGPLILLLGIPEATPPGAPLLLVGFALKYLTGLVGMAVSAAALVVALLALWCARGAVRAANVVLAAAIAYQVLVVLLPPIGRALTMHLQGQDAAVSGVLALLGGQMALADIGCAAALIWFVAASARPAGRERIAPAVTLAVLVLLFREGLRGPTAWLDATNFIQALGPARMPAAYLLTMGPGLIASVGAVLLLGARLLRWRGLPPAAAVLMGFAVLRLLAQLWLPGSHVVAPTLQGSVMHLGVYVTSLAGVAEYILLLISLPRK